MRDASLCELVGSTEMRKTQLGRAHQMNEFCASHIVCNHWTHAQTTDPKCSTCGEYSKSKARLRHRW